ncbi:hypothetical protein J1614_005181 [Plenodomus biglobosus]|nr:hypothetical protein J1614_005181 [Plenodomus biglobosus]
MQKATKSRDLDGAERGSPFSRLFRMKPRNRTVSRISAHDLASGRKSYDNNLLIGATSETTDISSRAPSPRLPTCPQTTCDGSHQTPEFYDVDHDHQVFRHGEKPVVVSSM